MKKILSALSVLFLAYNASAQTSGQVANYSSSGSAAYSAAGQLNSVLGPIQQAKNKLNFDTSNVQGSPYTADIFLPTTLFYGDENMGNIFYRYNAYNEEIEVNFHFCYSSLFLW